MGGGGRGGGGAGGPAGGAGPPGPAGRGGVAGAAVAGVPAGDERREVLSEQLAGVLFLLARYEQAEPVARGLLAETGDPQRRARMAWTLAHTLSRTGRTAQALAVLDAALRDGAVPEMWRARLGSARAVVRLS